MVTFGRFVCPTKAGGLEKTLLMLRIDSSCGSVNSHALFELVGMRWYQWKYYVLYNIRQPIMNPIY